MGFENNIEMLSLAFWQVLKLAGPVLLVALAIGLIIGIIQAATSINEMTLSFVPKVVIVILTIALFSNYLIFFARSFALSQAFSTFGPLNQSPQTPKLIFLFQTLK